MLSIFRPRPGLRAFVRAKPMAFSDTHMVDMQDSLAFKVRATLEQEAAEARHRFYLTKRHGSFFHWREVAPVPPNTPAEPEPLTCLKILKEMNAK